MDYQSVFKRYELKYVLSLQQRDAVLKASEPYMELDKYGLTSIKNIYFDTDSYRLIRNSIEKPVYKEKLRIRQYGKHTPDNSVFIELKKKFEDIVYKRRVKTSEELAFEWLCNQRCRIPKTQIVEEIDYFVSYYQALHPVLFLSYDRMAYFSKDGSDFRMTFDNSITCRQSDLCMCADVYGIPVLNDDHVLMELKCSGGIPLWMTEVLTKEKIYKTSFSKYGTAYKQVIFPHLKEAF
ncbi:MAG: polyphosphate polymerase domain-containing protein [Oscillospiraceae bacterium]|nr:polyphosphate polymerase domain-containing protein [Oscillospiraceae bacterium]